MVDKSIDKIKSTDMTRNNFFQALATCIFAPSILNGINWEGEQKCLFNAEKIKERIKELSKNPSKLEFVTQHRLGIIYYDSKN